MVSARGEIITRRTYCRPTNDAGTQFETWEMVIDRVIRHQRWLWERALTHNVLTNMPLHDVTEDLTEWVNLSSKQEYELEELRQLMLSRKALPSGRTLWLGGTDIAKTREASMFNCSHAVVETMYDVVDIFWLLLQGCGIGATPKVGTLNGFRKVIPNIKVLRSTRTDKGGRDTNEETFTDGIWTLSIGDSAEAWAKAVGKLLAGKYKAHTLILDFSEIRPSGQRLKGYGWISSGDGPFSEAMPKIAKIMNRRAGGLLSKLDIVEILNLLGTVLSSRRCLPENTTVYTEQGIKRIKNVNVGDRVYNAKGSLRSVTKTFDQGMQNTIKINTRVGAIECTPNHKIAIVTSPDSYEFRYASELKNGDKIAYPEFKMRGSKTTLPIFENTSEDNRAYISPNFKLDDDFAWFIGYFLGNGCVIKDKYISVAVPLGGYYFDTIKVIMDTLTMERNVSIEYPKENDRCYKVAIHSINLAKWFKTYIKPNKGGNMKVPLFIKNSDIGMRSSFLAGLLDSDGCLKTRPKILAMSICENFIKEVQELYASIGITTIFVQKERAEENWKTLYYIKLIGSHEMLKFEQSDVFYMSIKVENDYISKLRSQHDYGYPASWLGTYKKKNWAASSAQMTIHRFEQSGNKFNGLVPVPVESVEAGSFVHTYDIEVDKGHEFIAGNGWLSHNSAEIMLIDYDSDEWMEFAKFKRNCYEEGHKHKQQSNNSLVFHNKPSRDELSDIFQMMIDSGGSEPGFFNGQTAKKRAPFFSGTNPCGERSCRVL